MHIRTQYAAVGVLLAAAVLTGCAGKSTDSTKSTATPSASASPVPASSPSAIVPPSPTPPAVDQTVRITFSEGKVVGGAPLVKVKKGNTVAIVVTSDVADEVHFHGYDKSVEIAKGGTVTITFTANLQGRFLLELEELGRRLATVQVQ